MKSCDDAEIQVSKANRIVMALRMIVSSVHVFYNKVKIMQASGM